MEKTELEKAFIGVVQQYERIIYKVCSFYVSPEVPLADLYQDVICNLWLGFPKFRNESSVSTWIYRISLNTCISCMRKNAKRPKSNAISTSLSESLIEPENMQENIKEMYYLVNQLQAIEKIVVLLYLEENSYQEIADITGLTVSNVATKLKRAKEKLKRMYNH